MHDRTSFDYAVVRVVPLVERGEFLNVGVIVFCRTRRYLRAKIEFQSERMLALAPFLDMRELEAHLRVIPAIASGDSTAGPISALPPAGRFHWLVAPRSTVVQVSPVHSGLCDDPEDALEDLMDRSVRPWTPQR